MDFNGSDAQTSARCMNKYETNEVLKRAGFLVPKHMRLDRNPFLKNTRRVLKDLSTRIGYPLIAKPVDDGCSTDVEKVSSEKTCQETLKTSFFSTERRCS